MRIPKRRISLEEKCRRAMAAFLRLMDQGMPLPVITKYLVVEGFAPSVPHITFSKFFILRSDGVILKEISLEGMQNWEVDFVCTNAVEEAKRRFGPDIKVKWGLRVEFLFA